MEMSPKGHLGSGARGVWTHRRHAAPGMRYTVSQHNIGHQPETTLGILERKLLTVRIDTPPAFSSCIRVTMSSICSRGGEGGACESVQRMRTGK